VQRVVVNNIGGNHVGKQAPKESVEKEELLKRIGAPCCKENCMKTLTLTDMEELTTHFHPLKVKKPSKYFRKVARDWLKSCSVRVVLLW